MLLTCKNITIRPIILLFYCKTLSFSTHISDLAVTLDKHPGGDVRVAALAPAVSVLQHGGRHHEVPADVSEVHHHSVQTTRTRPGPS